MAQVCTHHLFSSLNTVVLHPRLPVRRWCDLLRQAIWAICSHSLQMCINMDTSAIDSCEMVWRIVHTATTIFHLTKPPYILRHALPEPVGFQMQKRISMCRTVLYKELVHVFTRDCWAPCLAIVDNSPSYLSVSNYRFLIVCFSRKTYCKISEALLVKPMWKYSQELIYVVHLSLTPNRQARAATRHATPTIDDFSVTMNLLIHLISFAPLPEADDARPAAVGKLLWLAILHEIRCCESLKCEKWIWSEQA